MRKLFNNVIIALLLIVVTACKDEPDGPYTKAPVNEKSYIQEFYEFNDYLHVSSISGFKIDKLTHSINHNTSFDPPKLYELKDGVGLHISISNQSLPKYKYKLLVEKIGDVSYNSKINDGFQPGGIAVALVDTLQTITITCDKAFNEKYPAGSSLNELFSIYFEEPYTTIKNGYKSSTGDNYYTINIFNNKFPYSLFGANLSTVDLSKKYYIGTHLYLMLETAPKNTGEYLFTVSVINTEGKILEKTANYPIHLKGLN